MRQLSFVVVMLLALATSGCYEQANEGVYRVQVVRGQITQIIKPQDGWVNTINTFGDEYYDFNLRIFTFPVEVHASTNDNAALRLDVSVTCLPPQDDDGIKKFMRQFGLDEGERWNRFTSILAGQIKTEVKTAVNKYDAYTLLKNQTAIQTALVGALEPILKNELFLKLQSVQITGRPVFDDQRIEQAAAQVVANQKLKEAAEASLAAAKVDAEQKQVQATVFKDPALLQIKKLELALEIEKARAEGIAKHAGPLTIVNGADTQIQLQQGGAVK